MASGGLTVPVAVRGHVRLVPIGSLRPNPWNPNVMDPEMFSKEIASVHEFGFVDPITVRFHSDSIWEIIDGEHRWKVAQNHSDSCIDDRHVGYDTISVNDLGKVDDETAQQLTIVLNETRGSPDKNKLAKLVSELASKRDAVRLSTVLPFTAEHFAELAGQRGQIDFAELQRKRRQAAGEGGERWVERIYRLPASAAQVLDEAIEKVKNDEDVKQDWRALEMIAADFLGSP